MQRREAKAGDVPLARTQSSTKAPEHASVEAHQTIDDVAWETPRREKPASPRPIVIGEFLTESPFERCGSQRLPIRLAGSYSFLKQNFRAASLPQFLFNAPRSLASPDSTAYKDLNETGVALVAVGLQPIKRGIQVGHLCSPFKLGS